ncbi:hypothetical protein BO85DRAFT_451347 [Aspergillus piperis CBS 112811]|uniref:Uncharacterized protein n=1 Tax=Aspergillus piperis CBS 112811 TaxID=1448313 RepID=A0A8G1VKR0_9EURO|nr:hypothetical protein BO85DRAFT_451347 [Aspergillus piperis CBS 112811]RAH55567.1 hypothetical protein BO85DRAFT_451347 [Aspergillus piperis CBS 112811]
MRSLGSLPWHALVSLCQLKHPASHSASVDVIRLGSGLRPSLRTRRFIHYQSIPRTIYELSVAPHALKLITRQITPPSSSLNRGGEPLHSNMECLTNSR